MATGTSSLLATLFYTSILANMMKICTAGRLQRTISTVYVVSQIIQLKPYHGTSYRTSTVPDEYRTGTFTKWGHTPLTLTLPYSTLYIPVAYGGSRRIADSRPRRRSSPSSLLRSHVHTAFVLRSKEDRKYL